MRMDLPVAFNNNLLSRSFQNFSYFEKLVTFSDVVYFPYRDWEYYKNVTDF